VLVICKVDPEHVVCVPRDSSFHKMRVCKYEVYGHYGSPMPSTTAPFEDFDVNAFGTGSDDVMLSLFPHFAEMTYEELLKQPIDDLRKYATELRIVGASKIPGGKLMLVARILEVRG
jgi:hypothetical protein